MKESSSMPKKELAKRYILFVISLFISGVGVAITKRGELGVSPISSVANVMFIRFPSLSLGNWLIIWNCILILGQILLLRRRFQPVQLLQIPLSVLFGYFTDFGMWMTSGISTESYPVRLGLILLGTAVLALGVTLAVIANVVMNSGEAFVKAISDTTGKEFGTIKIGFDVGCVTLAIILSMLCCGEIVGTREGTILAALLTGVAVKFYVRHLRKPTERLLVGAE